jgi:hypothetical protein
MLEGHRAVRLAQRAAQFELRVVGKQCARNDNRMVSAFALNDHPRCGAHHCGGRLPEDVPAPRRDLRHIYADVHLGEQDEVFRVVSIDWNIVFGKQACVSRALSCLIPPTSRGLQLRC